MLNEGNLETVLNEWNLETTLNEYYLETTFMIHRMAKSARPEDSSQ